MREHLLLKNYVFLVAMAELIHNYAAKYAAYAANGNQPGFTEKKQCFELFLSHKVLLNKEKGVNFHL